MTDVTLASRAADVALAAPEAVQAGMRITFAMTAGLIVVAMGIGAPVRR